MDTDDSSKPAEVTKRKYGKSFRRQLDIYNAWELAQMREEVHRLEAELEVARGQQEFWKQIKKRREKDYGI